MASERKTRIVKAPGSDDLIFHKLEVSDALGDLFDARIEMLASDDSIALDTWLAQPCIIETELPDGGKRHFAGVVAAAALLGSLGRYHRYEARLVPWLWLLDQSANCRVFQQQTAPDIIKSVFAEHGFSADVEDRLSASYPALEYCVQYRETDYQFVSRLMEQEGIYYLFRHEAGRHVLVLVDAPDTHERVGREAIPYHSGDSVPAHEETIDTWAASRAVVAGRYAMSDYDFTKPRASLVALSSDPGGHPHGDLEIFDYPGAYTQARPDGERLAKLRLEAMRARQQLVRGEGNARGIVTGARFELGEHPRDDQNAEYLVLGSRFELTAPAYESGASGAETFRVRFEAIPAQTPFRIPRRFRRPLMAGPQTATVVGPSGEEIWTDEYGRIKVQFPWDRYGERDENSSCWVRVAQVWAGKGWGGMMIPRIGQEVVVDFLEGDPDRPIVTGSVYNADNMPPFPLPDQKTQSGVRSRSSKSGGKEDFNELRFDDTKDKEEIYLHAQRDLRMEVENDHQCRVEQDQSVEIERDRTLEVKRDLKETIGSTRTLDVSKDDDITIGANRTLDVGQNYELTAGESILLKSGASSIELKSDGTVTIKCVTLDIKASMAVKINGTNEIKLDGLQIKVAGSTAVEIKSGVNLKLEGLMTKVQGTMLDLSGSALAKVKGGVTMLG